VLLFPVHLFTSSLASLRLAGRRLVLERRHLRHDTESVAVRRDARRAHGPQIAAAGGLRRQFRRRGRAAILRRPAHARTLAIHGRRRAVREIRLPRRVPRELGHGRVAVVLRLQVGRVRRRLDVVVRAGHLDGVLLRAGVGGLARVGGGGAGVAGVVVCIPDGVSRREHVRGHGRVGRLARAEGHLRRELWFPWGSELVLEGGVDGLEAPVLDHGLELAGVEEFGLFQQPRDEDGRRGFEALLDKGCQGHVAHDFDVFLQVQSVDGRLIAQLARLARLSRLVALDLPLVPQIDAGRRVDVRLQAPGHVVEDALEADLARGHLAHAGDVLDPLGDLVPDGEVLVGRRMLGRLDGVVLEDEGVELDDLTVRVEHVDGELARDARGEGRDVGVLRLLAHLASGGGLRPWEGCDGALAHSGVAWVEVIALL
jgi:hypothetical protein